ncbi:unnamed protein product, partial [Protopolystoma xenopodis]
MCACSTAGADWCQSGEEEAVGTQTFDRGGLSSSGREAEARSPPPVLGSISRSEFDRLWHTNAAWLRIGGHTNGAGLGEADEETSSESSPEVSSSSLFSLSADAAPPCLSSDNFCPPHLDDLTNRQVHHSPSASLTLETGCCRSWLPGQHVPDDWAGLGDRETSEAEEATNHVSRWTDNVGGQQLPSRAHDHSRAGFLPVYAVAPDSQQQQQQTHSCRVVYSTGSPRPNSETVLEAGLAVYGDLSGRQQARRISLPNPGVLVLQSSGQALTTPPSTASSSLTRKRSDLLVGPISASRLSPLARTTSSTAPTTAQLVTVQNGLLLQPASRHQHHYQHDDQYHQYHKHDKQQQQQQQQQLIELERVLTEVDEVAASIKQTRNCRRVRWPKDDRGEEVKKRGEADEVRPAGRMAGLFGPQRWSLASSNATASAGCSEHDVPLARGRVYTELAERFERQLGEIPAGRRSSFEAVYHPQMASENLAYELAEPIRRPERMTSTDSLDIPVAVAVAVAVGSTSSPIQRLDARAARRSPSPCSTLRQLEAAAEATRTRHFASRSTLSSLTSLGSLATTQPPLPVPLPLPLPVAVLSRSEAGLSSRRASTPTPLVHAPPLCRPFSFASPTSGISVNSANWQHSDNSAASTSSVTSAPSTLSGGADHPPRDTPASLWPHLPPSSRTIGVASSPRRPPSSQQTAPLSILPIRPSSGSPTEAISLDATSNINSATATGTDCCSCNCSCSCSFACACGRAASSQAVSLQPGTGCGTCCRLIGPARSAICPAYRSHSQSDVSRLIALTEAADRRAPHVRVSTVETGAVVTASWWAQRQHRSRFSRNTRPTGTGVEIDASSTGRTPPPAPVDPVTDRPRAPTRARPHRPHLPHR